MRRLTGALLLLAAGQMACRRPVEVVDREPDPPLLTTVAMNDPRGTAQLKSGFHELEHNAWRWTGGRFAVDLQPTRSAASQGARLVFRFSIPEVVIARLQKMTLSATVNGLALEPETYRKAGAYVYARDIPAQRLATPVAAVEFSLDRYLAAGEADTRELGVNAVSAGIEAK